MKSDEMPIPSLRLVLDLATVVFEEEYDILKIQALSIATLMEASAVNEIFIIINSEDSDGSFCAAVVKEILPLYGPLQSKVRVLSRSQAAPALGPGNGWWSQQALKCCISRIADAEYCLVLDAKNMLIRSTGIRELITEDGKCRTWAVQQRGHFEQNFISSCNYFGVPPYNFIDSTLPNITPFLLKTCSLRGVVGYVEDKEKVPFEEFFMRYGHGLLEFFLLAAFIYRRDGGLNGEYHFGGRNVATLFKDKVSDNGSFGNTMALLKSPEITFFGVHREAISLMSDDQKNQVFDIWRQAGIPFDKTLWAAALTRKF